MLDVLSIPEIKCVIIGSFRKHYDDIVKVIHIFESKNIEVTSPKKSWIINRDADFVILASDFQETGKDIKVQYIESKVLSMIEEASFIYLYNPDGYIGVSTAFEIGFAYKVKKPIFAANSPTDIMLAEYINEIILPQDIQEKIKEEVK